MEQSNYILCGDSSSVFIVVRTQYEVYPLNTLLSVQYSIVNYKHNVVQQNFRIYSFGYLTLYTFSATLPFPLPYAQMVATTSLYCFYEFNYF